MTTWSDRRDCPREPRPGDLVEIYSGKSPEAMLENRTSGQWLGYSREAPGLVVVYLGPRDRGTKPRAFFGDPWGYFYDSWRFMWRIRRILSPYEENQEDQE